MISVSSGLGDTPAVYADVSPNPLDTEIMAGRAQFRAGGHDGVIAIGGGSGMDAGKAIALVAQNDLDLWAFEFEQPAPDMSQRAPFPPLITVPTTAGTGAETESTAMVTDTVKLMKWCVWHAKLKPCAAVLDAQLTVGLPANLTAWTGMDAMIHGIEAYCVPGFNPLCDGAALEGVRLVSAHLQTVYRDPANLQARGAMLAGSCMTGVAFQKGLGLVHAIAHMVGAEYDTHHGLTNAILLPSVLKFNAPEIRQRITPLAQAMGLADTSFDAFTRAVDDLLDDLEIPRTLAEIGVPQDCAPRIAQKALHDSAAGTNPRVADAVQIEEIVLRALTHGR